jgi:predicted ATPase/transcriptional regulator with XRE-family HTH domain
MQVEAQILFGEWLRARRKALDLTQLDLAEMAGCAEDTIGRIEAGTRRPSKQVAGLLAEALGLPSGSQTDFVRFAREGTSGAGLVSLQAVSRAGVAARSTRQTLQPSAAPPAAWVPYLSSLPQSPTPLIDRKAELAATSALLTTGQARLLTLTGPPGVGKTRLALAVASTSIPAFPDGICFVPLAPLRDPDLLALTVAHALGLSDSAGGPQAARMRLVDFLRHKRLLLVLDNFEHILDATRQVAEWLSASAHLQILVTSRSALHLRGERLFPVSTLPVPPASLTKHNRPIDLSALASYPSVALFLERAQAVDPSFCLSESNARVVAELCRRMEGLPLAIELAAARSARLAPEIVLGRLGRRLDIVTSVPRDMPHHQRTLRAAIEWSFELLCEPERLLFARMSAFAGGATLDAMEAVCNAREDVEGGLDIALEGLLQQSLVYPSTVEVGEEEGAQAARRFNMLEMLREYATEQLAQLHGHDSGKAQETREKEEAEAASLRRYHAEYYLAMAEAADLHRSAKEQKVWLDRLEREHDNLRVAIQWALDSGELDMAAGLCGALWSFWRVRGYVSEGRDWLDKVLEPANRHGEANAKISPLNLARVLNGAGVLARLQGEYANSASFQERSLAIFRELDNKQGMANCLNNLGVSLHFMDQIDLAEQLYIESLETWRALEDPIGMSKPLHNLALIAQSRGDHERAIKMFKENVVTERVHSDKGCVLYSLYNIGAELIFTLDPDDCDPDKRAEAEGYLTEGLSLAKELGDKCMTAMCLMKFGELALNQGDEASLNEATALFEDALALLEELGDKSATAYTLNDLAFAEILRGDRERARSLCHESLRLSRLLEDRGKIAMNLSALAVLLGSVALESTSREAARSSARRAVQLYESAKARFRLGPLPAKLRYYQATMDGLGGLLSQEELEEMQALGQKMSLEEAIALAAEA